jgi:hypothetical protein
MLLIYLSNNQNHILERLSSRLLNAIQLHGSARHRIVKVVMVPGAAGQSTSRNGWSPTRLRATTGHMNVVGSPVGPDQRDHGDSSYGR